MKKEYSHPSIRGLSAKVMAFYDQLQPRPEALVSLERAVKFALGDVSNLVDFCQTETPDEMRLPFDCLAVEGGTESDEFVCLFKRVAGDWVDVFLFIRLNGEDVWRTTPGWIGVELNAGGLRFRIFDHGEVALFAEANSAPEAEVARCAKELARRAWLVLSVLNTLLECNNLLVEKIAPPSTRGLGKRKRRLLRFEYRVLTITGRRTVGVGTSGSHRSPRFHLRRGHIRHLPSGQKTWVSACAVGSDRRGVIAKDYRVKP